MSGGATSTHEHRRTVGVQLALLSRIMPHATL